MEIKINLPKKYIEYLDSQIDDVFKDRTEVIKLCIDTAITEYGGQSLDY